MNPTQGLLNNRASWAYVAIAIVMVAQLIASFCFSLDKTGLFQDESWTFVLANGTWLGVGPENGVLYHDGDPYRDYASVGSFLEIDVPQIIENQTNDNHPPLSYLLFSFAYSLFPGSVALPIGVMLNALYLTCATPLLFGIARRLGAGDPLALVVAVGWAFSVGTIDCVLFLRMYALLTFFFVALTYVVVRIVVDESNARWFVALGVTCALGFLTQYFFLMYAFTLCLGMGILLLARKKVHRAIAFGASAIAGIAIGYAVFPTSIDHILHSGRGSNALNAAVSGNGFGNHLIRDWGWINSELFANLLPAFVAALAILAVIARLMRRHQREMGAHGKPSSSHAFGEKGLAVTEYLLIAVAGVLFVVMVARVAPFASNRYLMSGYPIVFSSALLGLAKLADAAFVGRAPWVPVAAVSACALAFCLIGFVTVGPRYLNWEDQPAASLSDNTTTSVCLWSANPDDQTILPYVLEYEDNLYFNDFGAFSSYDFASLDKFTLFVQYPFYDSNFAEALSGRGFTVEDEGVAGEYFRAYTVAK